MIKERIMNLFQKSSRGNYKNIKTRDRIVWDKTNSRDTIYFNVYEDYVSDKPEKEISSYEANNFLNHHLYPNFEQAMSEDKVLDIEMDGYPFPYQFVEEVFEELVEKFGPTEVLKRIRVKSNDDPSNIWLIESIINRANAG
jgi:hypothetical protein